MNQAPHKTCRSFITKKAVIYTLFILSTYEQTKDQNSQPQLTELVYGPEPGFKQILGDTIAVLTNSAMFSLTPSSNLYSEIEQTSPVIHPTVT